MRKKYILKIIYLLLCFLPFKMVDSQDVHFSQLTNSPMYQNPAETGFSNYQYRFYLNQKRQWAEVTIPYISYAASMDFYAFKRRQKADMFGFGLMAFADQAGDSKYGTQQLYFSMSYIRALGKSNKNVLSIGVNGGYGQRNIDYSALTSDNQWTGTINDPLLAGNENYVIQSYNYFDCAVGTKILNIFNPDFNLSTGISIWHLNMPQQSLMGDYEVRLHPKIVAMSEANIMSIHSIISPLLYFSSQSTYKEFIYGIKFKTEFKSGNRLGSFLNYGLYIRNSDAIILLMGLDYGNFAVNTSYDFNVSKLHKASNYMGGLEFSLLAHFNKQKFRKIKELPCPIF